MYMHPNGDIVGYEGMSGWADDLWGGIKTTVSKAAGGFAKAGLPGAVSTITGEPIQTASAKDAWLAVRDTAVRQIAQRQEVQPVLRAEAIKATLPYLLAAGVLIYVLARRR